MVLKGHTATVPGVVITPDGSQAVSCAEDETIRVWSLATSVCVAVLDGCDHGLWRVAMSPDGKTVVSAAKGNTLGVWDLRTGVQVQSLAGHTDSICGVAIADRRVVTGSHDHTMRIWDL